MRGKLWEEYNCWNMTEIVCCYLKCNSQKNLVQGEKEM